MADNYEANAGSGGKTFRSLQDASTIDWPVGVTAFATTVGSPDVLTIPVAAVLSDDTSNPTTLIYGAAGLVYNGTTWDRMRGDAEHGILVNLGSNNDITLATLPDTAAGDLAAINAAVSGTLTVGAHAVTQGGNWAARMQDGSGNALTSILTGGGARALDVNVVQTVLGGTIIFDGTSTAFTSTVVGSDRALDVNLVQSVALNVSGATVIVDLADNNDVQGAAAHGAASSGNPFQVSAEARSSEATAVDAGDAARLVADLVGKLITLPYAQPELFVDGNASATTTNNTTVISAQGAGVRTYITSIQVLNVSSTDTYVVIKDGATGRIYLPAPANSGAVLSLPVPLRGTANTAWQFSSGVAVSTMHVAMQGYTGV